MVTKEVLSIDPDMKSYTSIGLRRVTAGKYDEFIELAERKFTLTGVESDRVSQLRDRIYYTRVLVVNCGDGQDVEFKSVKVRDRDSGLNRPPLVIFRANGWKSWAMLVGGEKYPSQRIIKLATSILENGCIKNQSSGQPDMIMPS